MNTILIWTVVGFQEEIGMQLTDTVSITVIARNENEALVKAQALITRPHYRVAQIMEQFDLATPQAKYLKKMLKQFPGTMPWDNEDESSS